MQYDHNEALELYNLFLDFIFIFFHSLTIVTRGAIMSTSLTVGFLQGIFIFVSFAFLIVVGILWFHRNEIKAMFPGSSFVRGACLYFTSTSPGKHALGGVAFFVGIGGILFALFFGLSSLAAADDETKINFASDARIELGVVRANDNAYGGDGIANDWVSHGVLSLSLAKYRCIDTRLIVWFHQSAAFAKDLRTMDASGLTISCTIPLINF